MLPVLFTNEILMQTCALELVAVLRTARLDLVRELTITSTPDFLPQTFNGSLPVLG